eukprot:gene3483-2434_t
MSLQCIVMRGGLWRWFDVCLCFRVCLGLDGLVACWVVDMNCQLIVVLMNLCITAVIIAGGNYYLLILVVFPGFEVVRCYVSLGLITLIGAWCNCGGVLCFAVDAVIRLVMIAVWAFIAYFVSYDAHFLFRLHVPKLWLVLLVALLHSLYGRFVRVLRLLVYLLIVWVYMLYRSWACEVLMFMVWTAVLIFWDFCMFYADFVAVIVCICLILVLSLGFVQCVWGGVGFLRNFVLWEGSYFFGEFNDYICGMIWLLRIVSYTLLFGSGMFYFFGCMVYCELMIGDFLDLMMHIITEHQDEFCYFPFTCLVVNGAIAAYLFGRVCNVMLFGDEFRQIYLGITDVGDMSVVYNAGFMLGNVDFGCLIVFGWLINEFIGMLAVLGKWLLDAMRTMDVLRWFVLMRLWIVLLVQLICLGGFVLSCCILLHLFMFKFEGAFFVLIVSLYNVWVVLTAMVTSDDVFFVLLQVWWLLRVCYALVDLCLLVIMVYVSPFVGFFLRGDYVLVSGYCIYLLAVHDLDSVHLIITLRHLTGMALVWL